MKIFGQISELTKLLFRKSTRLITVEPAAQTVGDATITIPDLAGVNREALLNSVAQTVTNKTLVVASNTITTAASGNLTATELNAALAELQTDIDTRALNSGLTSHTGANSGVHGVTGSVVGTTDSQTLSNKTVVVANNTITTAASGNLTATELNAALAELQTDIDTRALNSGLTSHTGANSGVHGVTGSVVGTTDTQALTNKDIDGGTASNTSRITVPKAASAVLSGLTRKQGTLLYDTTLLKLLVDDGSNLQQVGTSSSGINLISSPNDAGSWAASGAGVTVATTTTAAELPLSGVIASAIKITAVSGTDYARIRWTMPEALKNWKIPVSWYQLVESGYASGDFKVDVYTNDASDYSGSYTRKTLSSDSSSVTSIPAGNGFFGQGAAVSFDAGSEDYYEMRITRVSGTKYITLANVKVGPGELGVTPAMDNGVDYGTPSTNFDSSVDAAKSSIFITRFGAWAQVTGQIAATGNGTSASALVLTLPTGLTIDTTRLPNPGTLTDNYIQGYWTHNADSGKNGGVRINSTTTLIFRNSSATNLQINDITTGEIVGWEFRIPIAEWAGSVSTGPAPVEEFAYNSDTSDASTTASGFAYGPGGVFFGSFSTATRTKRVRFQYPIQADDEISLELFDNNGNQWVPASSSIGVSISATTGITLQTVNTTDIDVQFGSAGYAGSPRFAAGAWNGVAGFWKWRVRKTKKASLPYQNVSADASGLARSYSSLAKIRLHTGNGHGSTNTVIRRFNTAVVNTGSGITFADSATLGSTFTCTEAGVYAFSYSDCFNASSVFGISLNSSQLTTAIASITAADRVVNATTPAADAPGNLSVTLTLAVGDVIRPHTSGAVESAVPGRVNFTVQRIA